jgi:hypothetical protein
VYGEKIYSIFGQHRFGCFGAGWAIVDSGRMELRAKQHFVENTSKVYFGGQTMKVKCWLLV